MTDEDRIKRIESALGAFAWLANHTECGVQPDHEEEAETREPGADLDSAAVKLDDLAEGKMPTFLFPTAQQIFEHLDDVFAHLDNLDRPDDGAPTQQQGVDDALFRKNIVTVLYGLSSMVFDMARRFEYMYVALHEFGRESPVEMAAMLRAHHDFIESKLFKDQPEPPEATKQPSEDERARRRVDWRKKAYYADKVLHRMYKHDAVKEYDGKLTAFLCDEKNENEAKNVRSAEVRALLQEIPAGDEAEPQQDPMPEPLPVCPEVPEDPDQPEDLAHT